MCQKVWWWTDSPLLTTAGDASASASSARLASPSPRPCSCIALGRQAGAAWCRAPMVFTKTVLGGAAATYRRRAIAMPNTRALRANSVPRSVPWNAQVSPKSTPAENSGLRHTLSAPKISLHLPRTPTDRKLTNKTYKAGKIPLEMMSEITPVWNTVLWHPNAYSGFRRAALSRHLSTLLTPIRVDSSSVVPENERWKHKRREVIFSGSREIYRFFLDTLAVSTGFSLGATNFPNRSTSFYCFIFPPQ